MFLTSSDEAYSAIHAHWVSDNYPRQFNYQGYFWHWEDSGDPRNPNFRQMRPLPTFDTTIHTDRPGMNRIIPIDRLPKNTFNG